MGASKDIREAETGHAGQARDHNRELERAMLQLARAFSNRTAGPVSGYLLLALACLAAGVIALVWPGPTALVLVLVVGIWAFIGGCFEIFAAFGSGETAGVELRRTGQTLDKVLTMRPEPAPGRAARPSGR
jgi:short repeat uncharacterized protein DUF308